MTDRFRQARDRADIAAFERETKADLATNALAQRQELFRLALGNGLDVVFAESASDAFGTGRGSCEIRATSEDPRIAQFIYRRVGPPDGFDIQATVSAGFERSNQLWLVNGEDGDEHLTALMRLKLVRNDTLGVRRGLYRYGLQPVAGVPHVSPTGLARCFEELVARPEGAFDQ